MTQQVFNAAEGVELNRGIGFQAFAVTVNNLTQSWCYVSAAQTFVPPYQYGVVIPIPGSDTADIQWRTPSSLPTGPVGTGTLSATYTDAKLDPSNGVSVFTQQTQVVLGTVPQGTTGTFTLPGGCQGLMIIPTPFGAGAILILVKGVKTGGVYVNNFVNNTGGPFAIAVPVAPAADPVVTVQCNGAGSQAVVVVALFTSVDEPVTDVVVSGTLPNSVLPQNVASQPYLPVLQRPTFDLFAVRVNILIAGSVLIAAPGVGFSIVIRKLLLTLAATAAATDIINVGTTLTGLQLGQFAVPLGVAAVPQSTEYEMDYDDFLIGDNLPVDISSNVATFTSSSVIITYSIVTTANWPIG